MTDMQFTVTPEQYAGLTDAGKASLESALSKAGATSEYLASLKGNAPNKSGTPLKPAAADLTQPFMLAGKPENTDPSLRPPATAAGNIPYDQKIAAFQKLRGVVPDAQLQDAARAEGVEWSEIVKDAPAATPQPMNLQNANAKLAATSGPFAAGTEPTDYSFQFEQRHLEGLDENAVSEMHNMFRNGFFESTMPLSMGQAVAREAVEAANAYDNLDETQARLKYQDEGAKLRRLGNVEKLRSDWDYAWARLPKWFQEAANESRMFHTADSFIALARAGEVMRLRDSRKG